MDVEKRSQVHFRGRPRAADTIMKAVENRSVTEKFMFDDACVIVTRDHILPSSCHHCKVTDEIQEKCQVCEYGRALKLPQLPEMVFPNNSVVITYPNKPALRISFNALDALKLVDVSSFPDVEVGPSVEWQRSRSGVIHLQRGSQPFDWTYTSHYRGTTEGYDVLPTDETISIEKLKRRDPINFYAQLTLYEDELADHGCSEMNIRLRAMPTCLFLLCRFYLRVDGVLVRVCDTRLYKELGSETVLRQWTRRELKLLDSSLPMREYVFDRDRICDYLPVVNEEMTKLIPTGHSV